MSDAATVTKLSHAAKTYAREVSALAAAGSTTEATYYPGVRWLIDAALATEGLPFDVRVNTSEHRAGRGTDLPDVALYDSEGQFLVVCGEVKLPGENLQTLAASTERNNQVGRYLASTRAVIISNVRAFALVTATGDWSGEGAVPPNARRIEQVAEFWPSVEALKQGLPIPDDALAAFGELIETAATRFAPIAEPESLARILARQARIAKADLPDKFTKAVQGLLDDFAQALGVNFVGSDGEEFLRSSLIQTAFYGLFAGWALWSEGDRRNAFRWEDLSDYLKIPFLGSLFHEFRHPSRIKELRLGKHLDIATETLARVNTALFFKRFRLPSLKGRDEATATAITYFYEPFLEAFDPTLRKELGVWYTPTPIVRYQIGTIDRLLREELGCSRGFADERVVVLDPACGTGAYLIEALRYVTEQLEEEGAGATLAAKLLDAVCRRFIGFEILTAPFVVAQLQLYLMLARLGAAPDERHRPAVFLTNALSGWHGDGQLRLTFPELQDEHDVAQGVKRGAKVIVVLGNPPYNRFAGVPLDEEADLVDHYKGITRDAQGKQIGQSELFTNWGVRKHLLDDLYVRFFRLAEIRIGEQAEFGVVSFISNSSFLAGRSHPILRESLAANFQEIWIDNLNGDKYRTGKVIPAGLPGEHSADQSIFSSASDPRGIQVGTCITTCLKRPHSDAQTRQPATLRYREFWGKADAKRAALLAALSMGNWSPAQLRDAAQRPEGPRQYEVLQLAKKSRWRFARPSQGGFEDWPGLDDLFPKTLQGVNTNRGLEHSVVDTDRAALENRMLDYFSSMSFADLKKRHPGICEPRAGYDPKQTRERLRKSGLKVSQFKPHVLFPLDTWWLYYELEARFLNRGRPELAAHLGDNEFLVGVPHARQVSESRPLIASGLFDLHLHDWGSVGFPLVVKPDPREELPGGLFARTADELLPTANLASTAWERLKVAWGLKGDLTGEDARHLCRQLFRYALAISHSPQYETDHKDSLAQSWPHIPIPRDKVAFAAISELGEQLAQLLDPAADPTKTLRTLLGGDGKTLGVVSRVGGGSIQDGDLMVTYTYFGAGRGRVESRAPSETEAWRPEWGEATGDLYLNPVVYLAHVPDAVWRYELGGYPVLKKWLGYRESSRRSGKRLSLAELDHFRSMVLRISAVLTLHRHLDTAYEQASSSAWGLDELLKDLKGAASA